MRDEYKELQGQLHTLANWVEKENNVHSHSVPRRAAYTIARLEEENYQMRLLLNKRYITITEIVNTYIGKARLYVYLLRKKWKKT